MPSLYQRRSDGRWCVAIRADGRRTVRYAPTREAAEAILASLAPPAPPATPTLAAWIETWLGHQPYRPSTLATYRQVLAPVLARLGALPLADLTPARCQQAFVSLAPAMGARRRQMAFGALRRALRLAVEAGWLAVNPLAGLAPPRATPQPRQTWSLDQARRFLEVALAEPRRWSPLFVVLATGGLRIGEALGLQWSDVDWAGARLQVQRAVVWAGSRYHVVPPKTARGHRWVSLPPQGMAALRCQAERGGSGPWVFHGGRPPDRTTIRQALGRECQRAGVPRLTVHGLRHVAAAVALAVSGDPHAVAARLGHATPAITLALYGYALADDAALARQVGEALGHPPSPPVPTARG